MGSLVSLLEDLLAQKNVRGLERGKATSAIRILTSVIGDPVVEHDSNADVGRLVVLDGVTFITFHSYGDGTFDLIKAGAMAHRGDILYGWRIGQTLDDYEAELLREFPQEEAKKEEAVAHKPLPPLFASKTESKPKRKRKQRLPDYVDD